MNSDDTARQIESLIAGALRDQPFATAPAELEARVMAAIAARTVQPWWRLGFAGWPAAARLLFVLAGSFGVLAGLRIWEVASAAFAGSGLVSGTGSLAPGLSWSSTALDLAVDLHTALRLAAGNLPDLWLYGTGTVALVLYATFFGLGAVGYQALRRFR